MRNPIAPFIVVITANIASPSAYASLRKQPRLCSELLSHHAPTARSFINKATRGAIAYLSLLSDLKLLSPMQIKTFIQELQRGQLINPISESDASKNSTLTIHRLALESHLGASDIVIQDLKHWAITTLHANQANARDRSEIKSRTQVELITFPVTPGELKQGDHSFALTHAIEVMDAPVTQNQWVSIMGENPAYSPKNKIAEQVVKNGKTIFLLPDRPVENLTLWSALVFANRLSESMGLSPAYDLDDLPQEGRAEDGSLRVRKTANQTHVKINAPDGDIYRAEGFRLPTIAEMTYILSKARTSDGKRLDLDDPELGDHAWISRTPPHTTKDIRTKSPFLVDGSPFYDLLGNVYIFLHDGDLTSPIRGTNPEAPKGLEIADDCVRFGLAYCGGISFSAVFPWEQWRHGTVPSNEGRSFMGACASCAHSIPKVRRS